MLSLRVDEEKCTGCGLCQVVCALGQAVLGEKKGSEATGKILAEDQARRPLSELADFRRLEDLSHPLLTLKRENGRWQIHICRHCETPLCVDACVAAALVIDAGTGTVRLERERCVGCWSCVMECPFGAVHFPDTMAADRSPVEARDASIEHSSSRAMKCQGCPDWDEPLCASLCPTGAIRGSRGSNGIASVTRRRRAAIVSLNLKDEGYKSLLLKGRIR